MNFEDFEFFCTLFKYFWNQVAYMAPWELNLYTYMLIFDHNMRKEWRYEVKYLLEKSFFVVSPVSTLAKCVRTRKHLPNVEAAFAINDTKGVYTHYTLQKKDYETIIHGL